MAQKYSTLAFSTLLACAPLVAAAAEPAGSPERPATTAPLRTASAPSGTMPSETTRMSRTLDGVQRTAPPPAGELSVPTTPVPMNLPDEATASEVKGEYGIGVAGLVFGTVLIAALAVGIFYVVSRRNWSTTH